MNVCEGFELITICYDNTFYEAMDKTDIDEAIKCIEVDNEAYVYAPKTSLSLDKIDDNEMYDITHIDNIKGGIHVLYKNMTKNEVLNFVDSVLEEERNYITVFNVKNKINAKEYFVLE